MLELQLAWLLLMQKIQFVLTRKKDRRWEVYHPLTGIVSNTFSTQDRAEFVCYYINNAHRSEARDLNGNAAVRRIK